MKAGRFSTIEGAREVPLERIIVDVRSNHQIMMDWLGYPKNFCIVMCVIGVLLLLAPILLPILLFATVVCSDSFARAAQFLPMRYPAWSNMRDPGLLDPATDMPKKATGIMFFGIVDAKDPYERAKQVFLSADDLTRHMLVLGTTGSGKSEFLKGMTFNVLCWASGFFVADAKADNKLPTDMYSQVRMFLRDYDFLVVNYLLGGLSPTEIANMYERLSNGLQPATAADADTLVQMTSNMMVKASGDSKTWQERGLNLFRGVCRALVYKRDRGELTLSIEVLREYLSLDKIEELYIEGWKMANDGQGPWPTPYLGVKSYLEVGCPGFKIDIMLRKHGLLQEEGEEDSLTSAFRAGAGAQKKSQPKVQGNETYNQHGYRSDQVYPAMSLLIDTYGHIFKRKFPEVDMQDVVVNNRICVSLIPSLEKGSQEQESLGKLNLALLRVMMARALGSSVEGDVKINVDAKITASATPFALFLDEFAYQFAEGIALTAAQARSLNFFLCALAQDLEKLTEGERAAEAGAMMANQATKFFMKIVGSDKTHELAAKTLGEAQVAVVADFERDTDLLGSVRRNNTYRMEKRPRIPREVLEDLPSGFATFTYRQRAHVMRTFYPSASVPRVRYPRINRFLQIKDPDPITMAACSIELFPTEDKFAIDRIRAMLDTMAPVNYPETVVGDVIQTIAEAAKHMNPQTPAIERGIVLYQAGIEALLHAKKGASILGAAGGHGVKPVRPNQMVSSVAPTTPNAAVQALPSQPTATDIDPMSEMEAMLSGGAQQLAAIESAESTTNAALPAAAEAGSSSSGALEELDLDNFDPLSEIIKTVPPITRKPKEEVFKEEVSQAALKVDAVPEHTNLDMAAVVESVPKDVLTEDILDDQDLVLGDMDAFNTGVSAATTLPAPVNVATAPINVTSEQVREQIDVLSSTVPDISVIEKLGSEVVGLREPTMNGLVELEMALGATQEEAEQSAKNTEKAVAQGLSLHDNDNLNMTGMDVDLLFNEIEQVISTK